MHKWLSAFLIAISLYSGADQPRYLYKVISLEDWNASQTQDLLKLSKDKSAVLLWKIDQLETTILSDFSTSHEVIILEIDLEKLPYQVEPKQDNTGKAISYQYVGSIPMNAISEPRIIRFY